MIKDYTRLNTLINGGVQIPQRGTSFASITNTIRYTLDRWFAFTTSGTAQAQVLQQDNTNLVGFKKKLQFGRANGNAITEQQFICQCVESVNMQALRGKPVTFSFYAYKGANYSGGDISVKLNTGTSVDQSSGTYSAGPCTGYTGNVNVISTTQAITTSWVRYFFSGVVPSDAQELAVAIGYTPSGTAGADDNIYLCGLQLNVGYSALPFTERDITSEIQLCQRYYVQSKILTSTATNFGFMYAQDASYASGFVPWPVVMRIVPAVTLYDNAGNANRAHRAGIGDVGVEVIARTNLFNEFGLSSIQGISGWAAGNAIIFAWKADAEI